MNDSTVMTSNGPVMGVEKTSVLGNDYISFHKIPYAKAPVGDLRFKAPVPCESWTGVLDASQEGPACFHYSTTYKRLIGDEDCLHINVYTKSLKPSVLTPVMVYIYGGAFMRGSSTTDMYSPDFLLEKDVILVTFNYRLGPLGFLTLDDPTLDVPGNAGLKDQNLAMQWIKKNAESFGGDPNNITLFGESAGGTSVHFHMVSEKSKDLFNRAIVMSGCVLNHWAVTPRLKFAERLASKIGWNEEGGESSALEFLRQAPLNEMIMAQEDLLTAEERRDRVSFPFGPTIEPYVSESCFISKSPLELCRSAWSTNMDVIISGTSDEGLMSYKGLLENPMKLKSIGNFEYLVPRELGLAIDSEQCKKFGLGLKQLYYPDSSEPSVENIRGFINFLTDEIFWHGLHRSILSRVNSNNAGSTYVYRFAVDSPTFNHYKLLNCGPGVRGACHADDLSYIFKNRIGGKPEEGTLERKTIQRMVGMFTSFAKTGNPNDEVMGNVNWAPVDSKNPPFKCLNIAEELSFVEHPDSERLAYWDSMFEAEKLY